jgi:transposase-like protein
LELASDLGNVSRACRVMGYSRQQFYEIRRNFQTYGAEGLLDRMPGAKGPHPNRVAAEIETAILKHALAAIAEALVLPFFIVEAEPNADAGLNLGDCRRALR